MVLSSQQWSTGTGTISGIKKCISHLFQLYEIYISFIRRNDLVDMMLDVIKSNDDSVAVDDNLEDDNDQFHKDAKLSHHHNGKRKSLDERVVVGSAYNLLSAGYDTTSLALSFLGHKLALHPGIYDTWCFIKICRTQVLTSTVHMLETQGRLQDEVDDVLGGVDIPTYDHIAQMEYLDAAIHETIRMHPPLALLQVCLQINETSIHPRHNCRLI